MESYHDWQPVNREREPHKQAGTKMQRVKRNKPLNKFIYE